MGVLLHRCTSRRGFCVRQCRMRQAVITNDPQMSVAANQAGFLLFTPHIRHGLASALQPQVQVEGIPVSGKGDGGTCKGLSSFSWEVSLSLLLTPGLLTLSPAGCEVQCFHREQPARKGPSPGWVCISKRIREQADPWR